MLDCLHNVRVQCSLLGTDYIELDIKYDIRFNFSGSQGLIYYTSRYIYSLLNILIITDVHTQSIFSQSTF